MSIQKRLDDLQRRVMPSKTGSLLNVTLPDGRRATVTARDWWLHRYEWDCSFPRGDWLAKADPDGWPPALLFFARGFDRSAREKQDKAERDRLIKERDDLLMKYFGEVIE